MKEALKMREALIKFLHIGNKSYYVWKKDSHKILIKFLEQYFTGDEICDYINTGKVVNLNK